MTIPSDHFITYATLTPEGANTHPDLANLIFLTDHTRKAAYPSTLSPQHARATFAARRPILTPDNLYATLNKPGIAIGNRAPAHRWKTGDLFIVATDTNHKTFTLGQTVRLPYSFSPPANSANPDDVIFVDDPATHVTPGSARHLHPILARHLISIHDYPTPAAFAPGDVVSFRDQITYGPMLRRVIAITRTEPDPETYSTLPLGAEGIARGQTPLPTFPPPPNPALAHHLQHATTTIPLAPNQTSATDAKIPAPTQHQPPTTPHNTAKPGVAQATLRINGVEVTVFCAAEDMPTLLKALTARTSRR